ncbi:MAG: SH3 domain-containing protein [Tissierellia bacterium]|nr:SH3 domain-containing protein [Tissierellia bacterium]
MNYIFVNGKFSKVIALFLVFTLLMSFVDFSQVMAVSEEELLDFSNLNTDSQMISKAEKVALEGIELDKREQNFNENWKFKEGDEQGAYQSNYNDASWESISVPHDYSILKQYNSYREAESGYLDGGVGWYRKTFNVPESARGKTINVNFDGVYMNATVYVNGVELGTHPYGYTAFAFDLTDHINFGQDNVLAVKVDHKYPSSRWYSGSGIYRNVDLVIKDKVSVGYNGVKISMPSLASQAGGEVDTLINTTVDNNNTTAKEFILRHSITEKGTQLPVAIIATQKVSINANESKTVDATLKVNNPKLWGVDNPNLYIVKTEVEVDGKVVDVVENTTGFRYTSYSSTTGFSLNGEPMKLKGVCMHHDNGALGSREFKAAAERKIDILKEMGSNAIRVAHNPASQDLIDAANEKGILIIDEAFDGWHMTKNSNSYDYAQHFRNTIGSTNKIIGGGSNKTWWQFDIESMIKRGQNSPAIIMWSIGNEVMEGINGGQNYTFPEIGRSLASHVNSLDSTRAVTIGDNKIKENWTEAIAIANHISDFGGVVGMNYASGYQYDQQHSNHPEWLIVGAETASSVNSRGVYNRTTDNGRTYDKQLTSYDGSRVGWGELASKAWFDVVTRDYVMGEFVWTGFDYLGEPTHWNGVTGGAQGSWPSPKSSYFGIIDLAGLPKDSYYLYQSMWNDDVTTAHILPAWNSEVVYKNYSNQVPVVVYSNAAAVELFFTGQDGTRTSLGKKVLETKTTAAGFTYRIEQGKSEAHNSQYLTWNVNYADGKLEAVAYDAQGNIIQNTKGRSVVETAGNASKLAASPTTTTLKADGSDLSYITIEVQDAKGTLVPNASNSVQVEVTGNGKLLALDNGSQFDHSSYYGTSKNAYNGKMIAIIQSDKTAGNINVNISSTGLESQTVSITTQAVSEEVVENNVDYLYYPKNYYVKTGNKPVLPTQVSVVNKDDTFTNEDVAWADIALEQYNKPQVFTVEGLTNSGEKVSVNVNVIDDVNIILNTSMTTSLGVKPELPSTRPGVLADGTIMDVSFDVHWEDVNPTSYETENTFVVNGTATVFGKQIPVTASIRVQQATVSVGSNIAAQNMSLTQNIPLADQSDTLSAIVDGSRAISDNNSGGPNPSAWTNYSYSQKGNRTAEITFAYATQQHLAQMSIFHFEDGYSARFPDAGTTKIFVSQSGDEGSWTEVTTIETIGTAANRVKEYKYDFAPVLATFVKIQVTNKQETLAGRYPCTGITEVEIRKADTTFTTFNEAAFESFTIDGVALTATQLQANKHEVESLDVAIEYSAKSNTAITELPIYNGVKRYILESEDKSVIRVFELSTIETTEPGYEENENGVEAVDTATQYSVYPLPQSVTYDLKQTTLTPQINLVLSEGLDEYTVAKAKAILTKKGLDFVVSDTLDADMTNVVVGIKGSEDQADKYFTRIAEADIYNNIDAHRVSIKNQVISVLGKDSDAAFYGLVTLEHIFDQMTDNKVNNLLINDYSSQKIRGTIEGFYGVPWTIQEKKDLLEFGGKLKNNVFIFAPKDDPYHRDQWRELYPDDKLQELAELAKAGNENKNRFVWTISPFHNQPITALNVESSIEVLKAKFDQLYDAGIRQFGVLGDDVGSLPLNVVVRVMNAMSDWAKTKPEKVYDFVFCPYSYTLTWNWSATELNTYTQGFPDDVHIFFTGRTTCSPVTKADINEFKTRGSNGVTRKDPLFWLNWPVNDIDKTYRRLYMGMGEMLHNDVDNAAGVVTNPMQEAHASMNAIFAVADYTWNTPAFDATTSWKAGLTMIEPNASEALIEIATHMASANTFEPDNNAGVPGLQESEDMAPTIKAFEDVMNSTAADIITSTGTTLKERYQKIVDAVDTFTTDASDAKLKAEMLPYNTSLKEKSEAAIKYIEAITAYKNGNKELGDTLYAEAEAKYTASRSHMVVINTAGTQVRAESGTKRINPNIVNMRNLATLIKNGQDQPELPQIPAEIKGELISRDNENTLPLPIASFTNDTIIDSGSNDRLEHINDGIIDFNGGLLNRWTNWRNPARSGDWVGIMFGDTKVKEVKIDGIKLGFFEDHGVKRPKSYTIEYYTGPTPTIPTRNSQLLMEASHPFNDDSNWTRVQNQKGMAFALETMNGVSFDEVTTVAIRVKMVPQTNLSLVITEMEVYGQLIPEAEVDKTQLEAAIETAKTTPTEGKTPESIEAFELALGKAQTVFENPDATQEEVDQAKDELLAAIEGLEDIPKPVVDKSELEAAINTANATDTNGKTPESIEALELALGKAQNVFDNPDATQEEVDQAKQELLAAIEGLEDLPKVNKEALQALVTEAEAYDLTLYTEETAAVLTQALDKANAILINEEATQEEVDAMVTELQAAISMLELKPEPVVVDKSKLEEALAKAKEADTTNKTPESIEALEQAIDKAELILDNPDVTQAEVDATTEEVLKAIEGLQEILPEPVDKSKLEEAVAKARELDPSIYTDESAKALEEAIAKAQEVLNNEGATQEEVDKAIEDLAAVVNALEEKPVVNKDALRAIIEEARNADLTNKTQESVNRLLQLIGKGLLTLQREDATQEEVDAVVAEIRAAIDGLEDILVPVVDKSILMAVVKKATGANIDNKTDDSIDALMKAIGKALLILENPDATQEEVDACVEELEKAIAGLEDKPVIEELERYAIGASNIRKEPNTRSAVIGTLRKGAKVVGTIDPQNPSWIEVSVLGVPGYVHISVLSENPIEITGYLGGTTNVRSEANSKSAIVTTLKAGTPITGSLDPTNPSWIKVTGDGKEGYVYASLISNTTKKVELYATATVNVRSSASSTGTVIGALRQGTKVVGEIEPQNPSWVKFDFNGQVGYVYRSLLKAK